MVIIIVVLYATNNNKKMLMRGRALPIDPVNREILNSSLMERMEKMLMQPNYREPWYGTGFLINVAALKAASSRRDSQ